MVSKLKVVKSLLHLCCLRLLCRRRLVLVLLLLLNDDDEVMKEENGNEIDPIIHLLSFDHHYH